MSSRNRPPTPPWAWAWLLLAFPALTAAFGTVNGFLGQHNEHEMVTRLAFQCPKGQKTDGMCFEPRSLAQLAGYHNNFMGYPIPGGGSNGAVGAPDMLDPIPEGPEAHCDDADFIDIPGYPRTREQANEALQTCIDHLRGRFHQSWAAAARLLDAKGRIQRDMVEINRTPFPDCTFAFASLQTNNFGRAKCNVIEGLGRALHGVQDFYAHSNWVDFSDPTQPISHVNPPGLGRTDRAPFLTDLGATGPIDPTQIPRNLSTGCFVLPDATPGNGGCTDRVTHHTLTKDHGIIYLNGSIGHAGPDTPRAEAVPWNFELAVRAAVEDSREVWRNLRTKLRQKFGEARGDLMICSIVADNPLRSCRYRFVSVLLDRSRMTIRSTTQEAERRTANHIISALRNDGKDKATVIQFDQKSEIISPWALPNATNVKTFLGVDKESNIGNAFHYALDNMMEAFPNAYTDRGAIVLLTSGSQTVRSTLNTHFYVRRAGREGIRVHYGCFNKALLTNEGVPDKSWTECQPGRGVVTEVLKTGGVFAFVSSQISSATENFANLVMSRGLTYLENDNEPESITVSPGITIASLLSTREPVKYFSYSATAGEALNFTIRDLVSEGQGTGGCFTVDLMDSLLKKQLSTFTSCNGVYPPHLVYQAMEAEELMLQAEYNSGGVDDGSLNPGQGEIVFTLEVNTDMPEKRVKPHSRPPPDDAESTADSSADHVIASLQEAVCVDGESGEQCRMDPEPFGGVSGQQVFDAFMNFLPQLGRWINVDQVPMSQQQQARA